MREGSLLAVEHLRRTFGGLTAVDDVTLEIHAGEVSALIGPNGSGKTTTFNLVSGVLKPNSGSVRLLGHEIVGKPPAAIAERGLVRTFQQVRLFPEMTALENVMLGRYCRSKSSTLGDLIRLPAWRRNRRADTAACMNLLARVGLTGRDHVLAKQLGFLEQHLVEIARALACEPRVLLLDEPATGMIPPEVATLKSLIKQIAADGVGVLVVEHNMQLVMSLCERVTVLDFGRVIATGPPAAIATHPAVLSAYLGTAS